MYAYLSHLHLCTCLFVSSVSVCQSVSSMSLYPYMQTITNILSPFSLKKSKKKKKIFLICLSYKKKKKKIIHRFRLIKQRNQQRNKQRKKIPPRNFHTKRTISFPPSYLYAFYISPPQRIPRTLQLAIKPALFSFTDQKKKKKKKELSLSCILLHLHTETASNI